METIIENRPQTTEVFETPQKQVNLNLDFEKKHRTIKEAVLEILKNNEDAVKSDFILYMEYLKFSGQIEIKDFGEHIVIKVNKENMPQITPPWSVTRIRRELRADNEVQYDPQTQKKRERMEKENQAYFNPKVEVNEYNREFTEAF